MEWFFKILENKLGPIFVVIAISIPILKEYIKAISKSNFDNLFLPKDQTRWNLIISISVTLLLISAFIIGFGFMIEYDGNLISKPSFIIQLLVVIITFLWLGTTILLIGQCFYTLYKKFKKRYPITLPKDSKLRNYLEILIFSNFLSGIFFGILIIYINIPKYIINELSIYRILIDFFIYASFLFAYYLLVDKLYKFFSLKVNIKEHYKLSRIQELNDFENKKLFVLYSLDLNTIVLGNKNNEYDSDKLYLFDRNLKIILEFERENFSSQNVI